MTPQRRLWLDTVILAVFALTAFFALIAVLTPDLVAFGMMLIIPFLVLFPAPTAFIYVGLFTSLWFTIGRVNRLLGLGAGLLAMGLVGFGLPALLNARIDREDRAVRAADRRLPKPLAPSATLTIVDGPQSLTSEEAARNGCDFLCRSILYSRLASAVVMAQPAAEGRHSIMPRTWRIVQGSPPCDEVDGGETHFDIGSSARDLGDRIASRAMIGECLTDEVTDTKHVGLVLENVNILGPKQPFPWSLLVPRLDAQRVAIARVLPDGRSERLAQTADIASRRVAVPLRLTIGGSPVHGAIWELTRKRLVRRQPRIDRWLKSDFAILEYPDPAQLRDAIDRWLSTPDAAASRSDEILHDQFFKMVDREQADAGDVRRARALVLDRRTESADWIWMIARKHPESAQGQSDALLTRLESLPPEDATFIRLAASLHNAPPAVFRRLDPRLAALLRDPARQMAMRWAISRLGEAGPPAASVLFPLLKESVVAGKGDSAVVRAAISGICRAAPAIAPGYEQLERIVAAQPGLEQSLTSQRGFLWGITRIRLGRQPATISRPGTANSTTWLKVLQEDAAAGNCEFE